MYNKKSRPSARALAASIKENTNDLLVIKGFPTSKYLDKYKFDYVLNVGNSTRRKFNSDTTVINRPKRISTSANKRLARIRFKARKISAPQLWLSAKDIPACEFPVVGRTTYHMKAQGFWYCETPKESIYAETRGATHFIKFIKNTREFRAHVFSKTLSPASKNDLIVGKLSEKRANMEATDTIIKNHDNGYRFVAPTKSSPEVLSLVRTLAKDTILQFNLHYGGVDIVYSLDTKKVYVLEINTTPCLTDENSTTIDVYTEKFIELIGAERA